MVLLHLLARLSVKYKWELTVAHFNHCLRGRSSDGDERFVRDAARELNLRFISGRADVQQFARRHRLSIEMAARELRHEFLARTALRLKIPAVALAHHADDQVELFFVRLLRGAGGAGLGGMKWRSPSPADVRVELVRPLLNQSKAALEDCARRERIAFRQDASNASVDFLRNRIRNVLLPWLRKQFGPPMARTIPRLMEIVGSEADCVSETARRWLKSKRRTPFERLPAAIQRRCLQIQMLKSGVPAGFDLVERLRLYPGRAVMVKPRLTVSRDEAGRVLAHQAVAGKAAVPRFNKRSVRLDLRRGAGEAVFDGVNCRWQIDSRKASPRKQEVRGCEYFDADRIGARIVLRHWQPGDRFQPIGMPTPKKLQDVFANQKIARPRRHELVVGVANNGELFWVEGLRIGERFKLDKHTARRLKWTWQRL
jgi:tRNA(Ile)-lysidine synthase